MARPREFDDETLRTTALGFFWSGGYEKTSLSDISLASGVGNGSIYAAYGSKRGLFLAIFDPYCDSRVRIVDDAMATGESAIDSIRTFLEVVISDCANQPGRRGCLMLNSIAEFGESDAAVLELARRANRRMTDSIAERIRGARFTAPGQEQTLAAQILLMSQGLIASSRLSTPTSELVDIADAYCATLASL